jgi:hypothetical protein
MNRFYRMISVVVSAVFLLSVTGCENLPGSSKQQGAVIGGVGGAAAGAAVGGGKHQVLGALLGGALGAGAGYVVGANSDRISHRDSTGATEATQNAKTRPATAQDARNASTAEVNNDGFVTLVVVAAMHDAGFTDGEILNRLRATGQVFELTPEQQGFLRDRGLSENLLSKIQDLNRATQSQGLPAAGGVISRPVGNP